MGAVEDTLLHCGRWRESRDLHIPEYIRRSGSHLTLLVFMELVSTRPLSPFEAVVCTSSEAGNHGSQCHSERRVCLISRWDGMDGGSLCASENLATPPPPSTGALSLLSSLSAIRYHCVLI